jgi:hypothetical protein
LTTNFHFNTHKDQDEDSLKELVTDELEYPGERTPGLTYIPKEDYSESAIQVMETWPTDLHLLGKTRLALRDKDTKKTELRIIFGIIADRLRADTTVDLSAFAKTGLELDKLVIHVLGLMGRPSTKKYSSILLTRKSGSMPSMLRG